MSFYDQLSSYYDLLFPAQREQLNFIEKNLAPDAVVLDIGCATGTYAVPLAQKGYRMTAVDLDDGMIEVLREKIENGNLNIRTSVMNMEDIDRFQEASFDLLYCIGNTIVHLSQPEKILAFLEKSCKLLRSGGTMIVQIVNYDRVLKDKITELPQIVRLEGQLVFNRTYTLLEDQVVFRGHLIDPSGASWYSENVLYCLTKDDLLRFCCDAGFKTTEVFGRFDETEWSPDMPATIVRLTK